MSRNFSCLDFFAKFLFFFPVCGASAAEKQLPGCQHAPALAPPVSGFAPWCGRLATGTESSTDCEIVDVAVSSSCRDCPSRARGHSCSFSFLRWSAPPMLRWLERERKTKTHCLGTVEKKRCIFSSLPLLALFELQKNSSTSLCSGPFQSP